MKKHAVIVVAMVLLSLILVTPVLAAGFDEFGYNVKARIFNGTGEMWAMGKLGLDHEAAEAYMGAYAHDKLIMKWNAEWDRGNDEGWNDPNGYDAWNDNEWNGMGVAKCQTGSKELGSLETWHYKIVWIGANGVVPDGGYRIWGSFAMLMSHGTAGGVHIWDARTAPAGYGAYYK